MARIDQETSKNKSLRNPSVYIEELDESKDARIKKAIYDVFSNKCDVNKATLKYRLEFGDVENWINKQRSSKWSEEDNIGWDEAFACVTRIEQNAKNEEELQNAVTAEKWLKEIKFKYYLEGPKYEWTKKDDEMFDKVMCIINPGIILTKDNEKYCNELKDWIKTKLYNYVGGRTLF